MFNQIKLRYLLALLFFTFACQGDILRVDPVLNIVGDVIGQETSILNGRFIGSNRGLISNPDGGSIVISGFRYSLWNNCFEFSSPAMVSSNTFATYNLRSTVYNNVGGTNHVFFPNRIDNSTGTPRSLFTGSYFMFRYDIRNNFLDTRANWGPTVSSPGLWSIDGGGSVPSAMSGNSDTLNGLSLFQVVYLRNYDPSASNDRRIQFNFGSKVVFEKTVGLNNLSPTALREKYQSLANGLTFDDIALGLEVLWINYYETTSVISNNSTHSFPGNSRIKTCP